MKCSRDCPCKMIDQSNKPLERSIQAIQLFYCLNVIINVLMVINTIINDREPDVIDIVRIPLVISKFDFVIFLYEDFTDFFLRYLKKV